jgi:hypothetical protein
LTYRGPLQNERLDIGRAEPIGRPLGEADIDIGEFPAPDQLAQLSFRHAEQARGCRGREQGPE